MAPARPFAAATILLVSCNALLGIEDRSPRETDASPAADGGSDSSPSPTSDYRSVVLDDKPVVYLRLGETATTVAKNEAALGALFDGTYPSAGIELGVPGALRNSSDPAIRLQGSRFIRMPASDRVDFEGTRSFSVEAWVRPAPQTVEYGYLFDHEVFSPKRAGWGLIVGRAAVYFERWANGVNLGTVATSGPLTPGQWHHLVGTYDGSVEYLYVDGVAVGRTESPNAIPQGAVGDWAIGGQNCLCTVTNFIGDADEVAVYDGALTEARVRAHHDAALR